jgi:hypothetical protein
MTTTTTTTTTTQYEDKEKGAKTMRDNNDEVEVRISLEFGKKFSNKEKRMRMIV